MKLPHRRQFLHLAAGAAASSTPLLRSRVSRKVNPGQNHLDWAQCLTMVLQRGTQLMAGMLRSILHFPVGKRIMFPGVRGLSVRTDLRTRRIVARTRDIMLTASVPSASHFLGDGLLVNGGAES